MSNTYSICLFLRCDTTVEAKKRRGFRGNQMVYGEAEYRFPISQCGGLWGGVVFVNATTANSPIHSLGLFESVKPGYGFGFRFIVDKKSHTNLAIDLGFGEKSTGFYLSASETF